ncbi:MAG: hypothetical protein KF849_04740 [Rhizobiaceae bacterium]|nr:hypothetical protein [Rhizobiaceae bacterium]
MRILLACVILLCGLPAPVFAKPAGMTAACNQLWSQYQSLGSPKAFATGKPDACGAKGPGGGTSLNAAKQQAIAACKKYGGTNCKVVDFQK